MVEVTIKNFAQQVELFEEKLKNATFISMNEKLSGLNVDEETFPDYFDSPEVRYQKIRKVASTFNIMQMGICLFQKEQDGSFIGTPFTFYLFPPPTSGIRKLQIDVATAHQHKASGIDFNKWAYEGIPFLPDDQYMQRREMIIEHTANKDDPDWQKRRMKLKTTEEKELMAQAMSGLDAWVKTFGTAGTGIPVEQSPGQAIACYAGVAAAGTGREFVLPECNSYMEKALYQEIEDRYPFLTLERRSIEGSPKHIVASFPLTEGGQLDIDSKVKAAKLAVLDQESTFRRVYTGLIESKKPIVGHNCLYELIFLCSHCESKLPESYHFWKKSVHRLFPHLYDTKTLASLTGDYSDTSMAPLYTAAMAQEGGPAVLVDALVGLYPRPDGPVDAGLGAWMAGAIFARIGGGQLIEAHHAKANAMFCCRTFYTVNMVGEDTLQPGVLHLSAFNKTITNSDLLRVVGLPDRIPMRVKRVPARVTDGELKKYFSNIGPVSQAAVVPAADGVSEGTGFVVFQDPKHLMAALQAAVSERAAAESAGGHADDLMDCEAVKIGPLRWITYQEAFLILPGCTDEEAMALVSLSNQSVCRAVPLKEYLAKVRPDLLPKRMLAGLKRMREHAMEIESPDLEEMHEGARGGAKHAPARKGAQARGGRHVAAHKGKAVKGEEMEEGEEDQAEVGHAGRGQERGRKAAGGGLHKKAEHTSEEEAEEEEEHEEHVGKRAKGAQGANLKGKGRQTAAMQERGRKEAASKRARGGKGKGHDIEELDVEMEGEEEEHEGGKGGKEAAETPQRHSTREHKPVKHQMEEQYEEEPAHHKGTRAAKGEKKGVQPMSMQERGRKGAATKQTRQTRVRGH